jgi:hypothetical protein
MYCCVRPSRCRYIAHAASSSWASIRERIAAGRGSARSPGRTSAGGFRGATVRANRRASQESARSRRETRVRKDRGHGRAPIALFFTCVFYRTRTFRARWVTAGHESLVQEGVTLSARSATVGASSGCHALAKSGGTCGNRSPHLIAGEIVHRHPGGVGRA